MKEIDCIGFKNIQILDGEGKPIDAIQIDNPCYVLGKSANDAI